MLCSCSGEKLEFEEIPDSPESLATRDFSASYVSSKTGEWDSRFDGHQVDEVESTLKEALSLNYEEARALLGRLEYQKGSFDGALQVFKGIDLEVLMPKMAKAIEERIWDRRTQSKVDSMRNYTMSMHSVSLLLESILLKAKSLEELGRITDAAKECTLILDTVESSLPNGIPRCVFDDCKMQEMVHRTLELLPILWKKAGHLDESISAYRRALGKSWNLDSAKLANLEKDLASLLLYGGVEATQPPKWQSWSSINPSNNIEEAILLLFILLRKMMHEEILWDEEIIDHLSFALSISGQYDMLAKLIEQMMPGIYRREERWYTLALCYSSLDQSDVALNLLRKNERPRPHFPSLILGSKLCSINKLAFEGIRFGQLAMEISKIHQKHFNGVLYHILGVCHGNCARLSYSDSQKQHFQKEALRFLNRAAQIERRDPEIVYSLGLENAVQRNIHSALENARTYIKLTDGSSGKGWKLLALVISCGQCHEETESIIDIALDETRDIDRYELLKLKAMIQTDKQKPGIAIETYHNLLTQLGRHKDIQLGNRDPEEREKQRIEMEVWDDLANIYMKLGSFEDAKLCLEKSLTISYFSPNTWHTKGTLFENQSSHREALFAFLVSLSVDSDYVPSMVSVAAILFKILGRKSLPIARSILMNALRLDPTNHDAWFHLGHISKMNGSLKESADFFQAAYELKQTEPIRDFALCFHQWRS